MQSNFFHDYLSPSFQDIVIATPGRLKDLMEMGVCNLKDVSFAVSIMWQHGKSLSYCKTFNGE